MRKTREELDKLREELGTDRLWSYSRVNVYQTCSYSYYLKYIKREKEDVGGVYLDFGNAIHDALEKFYNGEKDFSFINEAFEETKFASLTLAENKFNNADEDKNKAIEEKYLACLDHFTKNHVICPHKVVSEAFVTTTLTDEKSKKKYHFMGYVDAMHYEPLYAEDDADKTKDLGGTLYITDYKTSTRYSGVKIAEHANQLILNALGFSQTTGFPLTRIRARWNFLKYMTVSYVQKNKKIKETIAERHAWVDKIKVNLRARLNEIEGLSDIERESMVMEAITNNNLDNMPESIREAYSFDDAFVYVDLSLENVYNVVNDLILVLEDIIEKESKNNPEEFKKTVMDSDSYYCSQLCGYRDRCPYYKEYIDNKMLFINKPKEDADTKQDENDDWLRELGII